LKIFNTLKLYLGKRGHDVTVVSPFQSDSKDTNVKEIIVTSTFDDTTDHISKVILTGNLTEWQIVQNLVGFMTPMMDGLQRGLKNSQVIDLLKPGSTFDVTVTMAVGGGELGYYIAHKLNSSLVLYFAQQLSLSTQTLAMGQPHNPAYIPLMGMTFQ
jgi:hypothetical protein